MSRILLTVEYDGTAYAGWQRQLNGLAVQQVLEEALTALCREEIRITGASRTDAGVHAWGQRAHFDTVCRIPPEKIPYALNTMLPPDIRVREGMAVPDGFHARFLTSGKCYTYRIWNAPHASALRRLTHWHVPVVLDGAAMEAALGHLQGRHDFAAFQAAGGTARTTVREITAARLTREGEAFTLTLEGTAFLYNMVRIIAGTLAEIGHGKLAPDAFATAIRTGDRLALGPTAPPHGLELTRVDYPPLAFTDPEAVRWHKE